MKPKKTKHIFWFKLLTLREIICKKLKSHFTHTYGKGKKGSQLFQYNQNGEDGIVMIKH